MSNNICEKCGTIINNNDIFCTNCGQRLTHTDDSNNLSNQSNKKRKGFFICILCIIFLLIVNMFIFKGFYNNIVENTFFTINNDTLVQFNDNQARKYGVKEITIPKSVKYIESKSFADCTYLTSIKFTNNVVSIGDYAFSNCSSLTSVRFSGMSKMTNIGDYAFSNCSSLTSIKIPKKVTNIGKYAFSNCNSLTSIEISKNIESIGERAFSNCDYLNDVNYKGKIEDWCNIKFVDSNSNPMYFANHIYMLNERKKSYEVTEIEIPNTITKIGDYQFYGFNNVTKVVMSENIESIGNNAFASCDLLEKLYYEGTIEDWCNIVFTSYDQNPMNYVDYFYMLNDNEKWYKVTEIEIPDTITKIGDYQFYGLKNLIKIFIPNSVKSIGNSAFEGCESFGIVCYKGTIEDWCNIVFTSYDQNPMNYADFFYMLNDNNEWYEVTQIEIPATVTKIGDYQFYGFKYLKEVIIPSSVTSIGQSVFVGCKSLTIYCKAESKPVEWPSNWNVSYATVYWANEWEYDSSGNPKPKK